MIRRICGTQMRARVVVLSRQQVRYKACSSVNVRGKLGAELTGGVCLQRACVRGGGCMQSNPFLSSIGKTVNSLQESKIRCIPPKSVIRFAIFGSY